MKKRAFERIAANLEFRCFDIDHFGTVTDLSENGMFISSQKISFPLESKFEISLHLKEEKLNVPVKISRVTKSNGYYDGIGVELLQSPKDYLKLVKKLRSLTESEEH